MFAELSNYLDERLDDSLCEELEKHMEGCEPCQEFLSSLRSTIEECRKSPADFLNSKRAAKLRKQIVENYRRISAVGS
jgi:anti-sigma factor RsiW